MLQFVEVHEDDIDAIAKETGRSSEAIADLYFTALSRGEPCLVIVDRPRWESK